MSFDDFMRDKLIFVKSAGGAVKDNIAASVQGEKIITFAADLPIEQNDHFLRKLPSGLVEDYIVLSPNFNSGFGTIDSHWEIKVRRTNEPVAPPQTVIQNIIGNTLNGHNSRITGGNDSSKNKVIINSEKLFSDLRDVIIKCIEDETERSHLLRAVTEMNNAHNNGNFLASYQNFITTAADHMTVIGPFLPALSQLL